MKCANGVPHGLAKFHGNTYPDEREFDGERPVRVTERVPPLYDTRENVRLSHERLLGARHDLDSLLNYDDERYCDLPYVPTATTRGGGNAASVAANQVTGSDLASSMVRHMRKPISEIKKFGGNSMEYGKFIRQFQTKIIANTDSDDEKLNYLEQFTVGETNKVVNGFNHLDAVQGFPATMRELEDRYGDNQVIATAFVKKALDWPLIKPDDAKALDEFSLFLVECENAISSIEAMKVLEYDENMKRLICKLPFYLHDRWRNLVMRAKRGNETVKFRHLVQFIKEEAKKANHPVYGREALVKQKNNPGGKLLCATGNRLKSSAAACQSDVSTETKAPVKNDKAFNRDRRNVQDRKSDVSKSCLYCQSPTHLLDKCNRITDLSPRDRYDFMRSKGLCFGCLRFGHIKSSCRDKASCTSCGGRHPTILHVDGKADAKDDISSDDTNGKSVNLCGHIGAGDGDCAMAIIPVRVKMKKKMNSVVTYAFIDSGSSVSFCSDRQLRQVGGHGKPMLLNTMGEPYSMDTCAVTGLQVCSLDSNNLIDMPCVYTKDAMPVTRHHIPSQRDIERWPHLQDMKLPELNAEIGLMIGNNVPDAYAPLEIMTGPRGSPHATRTLLGWISWNVVRPNDNSTQEETATNVIVNRAQVVAIHEAESLQQLDRTLRDSINRERLSEDKREMSSEDKKFLKQCESSVQLVGNHYCMKLPFRNIDIRMPNNQSQALERLTSQKRKLTKNSRFSEDYTGFMNKILDCGYAEKVPDEDLDRDDGRIWYIPHHGVYHPKKSDKIRVVFDCTTSFRGVFLNSQLLPGPDLTNSLLGVLRFCQGKAADMGDVESMFYQVRVSEEDVDCLRFF